MKGRFFLNLITILVFFLFASINKAEASVPPDFPSCANPTGVLKVSYNEGIHGVPGNSSEFTGQDSVYTINNSQLIQCLCTVDGRGIQSNWWKLSSLEDGNLQSLIDNGWVLVEDGSLWGLDPVPYLVKNGDYNCLPQPSLTPTPGGSTSHDDACAPGRSYTGPYCGWSPGTENQGGGGGTGGPGGSILGISTGEILGLAATGNILTLYAFTLGGVFLIALGLYLGRSGSKKKSR